VKTSDGQVVDMHTHYGTRFGARDGVFDAKGREVFEANGYAENWRLHVRSGRIELERRRSDGNNEDGPHRAIDTVTAGIPWPDGERTSARG